MSPDNHDQSNPYDFFLKNNPGPGKQPLLSSNRSFKQRVIIVGGGGLLLIILIIIGASFIGGTPNAASLTSIAEQQNELIQLSSKAANNAVQPSTQNLAINIDLSLTTSQQALLSYLKSHGKSVGANTLTADNSASTTNQLSSATNAGDYDNVFIQIIQNLLSSYSGSIKQTFEQSSTPTQRQILNAEYETAQTLIDQANISAKDLGSS
ncbi:MAG TPA: hypothetical protein VMR18_04520 [Candidatus Saccharimonadales bacterium]|jgi:hypothetical protein|nr:hypothetical protein [Candidatus Saccharimonadales bacterium]